MTEAEELQLSWLRAFLAVYDTGSFTAAGKRVHRAQSRVSGQIAQLELHLGVQLFVRGRSGAVLTEAGRAFLPYAQAVLRQVEAGVAAVASRDGVPRGRVTVATYPGASARFLAPFIKVFCDRHPQAHVEVRDALGHDPEASVVHGDVDLAIRAEDPPTTAPRSSVDLRLLFREPIVCLLPAEHPAAAAASVTPAVFDGQNVIMTGPATNANGRYSRLLAESGARPERETVVGQPTTVTALVAAGAGLGVAPALAAKLLDTGGRVVSVPVGGPGWIRDVTVVTNRSRHYPPVVTAFMAELLAAPLPPELEPPAERSRAPWPRASRADGRHVVES